MVADPQLAPVVVVEPNPQMESETAVEDLSPEMAVAVDGSDSPKKNNRIQVSNTKKPLFFYLNLAKRYIKQHNYVELSALGMAIPTAVTISEILKSNGLAVERKVVTSTVGAKDETKGRLVQKAKLEILLERCDKSANQKTESTSSESQPKAKAKSEAEVKKVDSKASTATDQPKAVGKASEGQASQKAVVVNAPKTIEVNAPMKEERIAQPN